MNRLIPRMRMFAGPNGSGKSTLKSYLSEVHFGIYINPDEIELKIREHGFLDLASFHVTKTAQEVTRFFAESVLSLDACRKIGLNEGRLDFSDVVIDSYIASAIADFLRQNLLESSTSFTFETVMSHPSKVEILEKAQKMGYRTYLYYVATDDPEINISRVRNRMDLGGHSVPDEKVESRYHRSLDLLLDAIKHTNRAYIFDNSGNLGDETWLAEITDGKVFEMKSDRISQWFQRAVLDKVRP